jgi:hypothetical protein
MTLVLNGTTGIAGVDGSAATPAVQGADTNTGVFYGTDIVAVSTGGTERMRINASGQAEFTAGTAALPAIATTGDTNTGIFFSAADTIDFTEGGVATGQFDSSGNFKFNSGYGSAAVAYGCRAWVNFNGTGTVAIRGSGNVTSITDNGTGDYTVNFTTAIVDANYSAVYTVSLSAGAGFGETTNSGLATTTARFRSSNTGATLVDATIACASFFR